MEENYNGCKARVSQSIYNQKHWAKKEAPIFTEIKLGFLNKLWLITLTPQPQL